MHHLPRRLKDAIGKWAYIAAAIAQSRRARTPDLLVKTAGRTIACRLAICANASRYGGGFVVAPDTHAMRAGLQLVLVKDDSLLGLLRIGWRLLARKPLDVAGVCIFGANDAETDAAPAAPAQLDCEKSAEDSEAIGHRGLKNRRDRPRRSSTPELIIQGPSPLRVGTMVRDGPDGPAL